MAFSPKDFENHTCHATTKYVHISIDAVIKIIIVNQWCFTKLKFVYKKRLVWIKSVYSDNNTDDCCIAFIKCDNEKEEEIKKAVQFKAAGVSVVDGSAWLRV